MQFLHFLKVFASIEQAVPAPSPLRGGLGWGVDVTLGLEIPPSP
jgi:hypothetical protein